MLLQNTMAALWYLGARGMSSYTKENGPISYLIGVPLSRDVAAIHQEFRRHKIMEFWTA